MKMMMFACLHTCMGSMSLQVYPLLFHISWPPLYHVLSPVPFPNKPRTLVTCLRHGPPSALLADQSWAGNHFSDCRGGWAVCAKTCKPCCGFERKANTHPTWPEMSENIAVSNCSRVFLTFDGRDRPVWQSAAHNCGGYRLSF